MVAVAWFALGQPAFYAHECEHSYLPTAEARFGFRGGRVGVSDQGSSEYALVQVDPSGFLGRAGFRSGDVPVAHHGGLASFCYALQASEAVEDRGEVAREVSVVRADDRQSRRTLVVPIAKFGNARR